MSADLTTFASWATDGDSDIAATDIELTTDEAKQITGRIRQWANDFPGEDVVRAYRGRIWLALGYASWAEWCDCELGGLNLPIPQRREVVAELAGTGMSNRAIAEVIGASEPTVRRDRGASNDAPVAVTGQDGKRYPHPAPKPVAPLKPRRRPLPELARDVAADLDKVVRRLEKLAADDRFDTNTGAMAPRLRWQLEHAMAVCGDVEQRLARTTSESLVDEPEVIPHLPKKVHGPKPKHDEILDRVAAGLTGTAIVLADIKQLNNTIDSEKALRLTKSLSGSTRELNRINRLLKERTGDVEQRLARTHLTTTEGDRN